MDIAARYEEAKRVTGLFEKFGAQGATAYATVAPGLLDLLNAADGRFLAAIDSALTALTDLAAAPNTSVALTARIDDLKREYAKRISRLVDVSALAAKHFAILINLTGESGPAELFAAGISQRRIDALYPFDLNEHMPAICAHALHGESAGQIASLLRDNHVLVAWNAFDETVTPGVVIHDGRVMQRAFKIAHDYLRATYGPYEVGVTSQYENVVSLWAYLLTFLHEVAAQQRPTVNARTKQASMMKAQIKAAERLAELIRPATVAAA